MRTLVMSPRPFWPLDTGGKLRDYHLAAELARVAKVTYLCYRENDTPCPADLAAPFERLITVPRGQTYGPATLIKGLLGSTPVSVLNYTTPDMASALAKLLQAETFDTIQVETVCLAAYMPTLRAARSSPKIVSDWHNIESELMDRYADHSQSPARRLYARATARKLRAAEDQQIKASDAILVCSARERDHMHAAGVTCPIHIIENGVEAARFSKITPADNRNTLLFVGSMDYHANIDAVLDFAKTTWPAIHRAHPDLAFKIVGRNPTTSVQALAKLPGIAVTGSVPDVRPYYAEAFAAVVPLRVGGGTRLKILEAMAAKLPVISSTLGAEGLNGRAGHHLLIADTPDSMQSAVTSLRTNAALAATLTKNASELISTTYDWPIAGRTLAKLHTQLLTARHAA